MIDQQSESSDEQLRIRLIILKSHFARTLNDGLTGADRSIRPDLHEASGYGFQAIQIVGHFVENRPVGGRLRRYVGAGGDGNGERHHEYARHQIE